MTADDIPKIAEKAVMTAIKCLLETKHLYQSIDVSLETIAIDIDSLRLSNPQCKFAGRPLVRSATDKIIGEVQVALSQGWIPESLFSGLGFTTPVPDQYEPQTISFTIPSIKTFCSHCKESNPHNPESEFKQPDCLSWETDGKQSVQVFSFHYICQGCQGHLVFMVKREGLKLALTGRYPMERVDTPAYIPRDFRKYYNGAVIAFNSGQTLPAIFMLRTFIEQFMRSVVEDNSNMTGDQLSDAYADTLDEKFKSSNQSLKPIYGVLSEAIHSATDDSSIVDNQKMKILAHFEAMEMFERHSKLLKG